MDERTNQPNVRLHSHALARIHERGVSAEEVVETVLTGSRSEAKAGRTRFSRRFVAERASRGREYRSKLVEAYAVDEDGWLVITVVVKFSQDALQ